MTVRIGDREFDNVVYDAPRDVLYLRRGKPRSARETLPSPEGHAIRIGEDGEIIGITIVGAKWWADRDGQITVTIPATAQASGKLRTSAAELAPVLAV